MIQLLITQTGKGYSPKDTFCRFNQQTLPFSDMAAARKYLKEQCGKCKRVPMYVDGADNKPVKCGYIYCFRNDDISHVPVEKWIQQDWVEFREVKTLSIT